MVVSLIAGVDTVVEEIAHAHEHGVVAIHLPGNPATAVPELPHYNHDMYEPIWRALDEQKMLAIFHASVGREAACGSSTTVNAANMSLEMMTVMRSHETAVAPLLLAGVPERFPNMRFGWIESGCAWVPSILDACDMHVHGMAERPENRLGMLPTEQWKASCFAAGPIGKADVAVRDRIGIETIMFGSDFIHVEGTYPNSRADLDEGAGRRLTGGSLRDLHRKRRTPAEPRPRRTRSDPSRTTGMVVRRRLVTVP